MFGMAGAIIIADRSLAHLVDVLRCACGHLEIAAPLPPAVREYGC